MTTDKIYKHLLQLISSERFLKMEGLNKEVPFFICPYACKDTVEVNKMVTHLTKQLELKGVNILHINLYDLSIEMLEARGMLDRMIKIEPKVSKRELMELLSNVLDPEKHLTPKIAEIINGTQHDVLFLTGVGEVYPYLRTHNILDNLHSKVKDHPTVIFFPGDYVHTSTGGSTLSLFSRLKSDQYYRALNILNCSI